MRLHMVGMQQNFTPAAQRHTRWRRYHWERGVFQGLINLLSADNQLFNLWPHGNIHRENGQTQIGACGEVGAFIVDDHRLVIARAIAN